MLCTNQGCRLDFDWTVHCKRTCFAMPSEHMNDSYSTLHVQFDRLSLNCNCWKPSGHSNARSKITLCVHICLSESWWHRNSSLCSSSVHIADYPFWGGDAEAWCSGRGFGSSIWLHVLCMACQLRISSVSFQVDRHNVRRCRKVGFDNSRVAEGGASWKTPQKRNIETCDALKSATLQL